MSVMPKKADLQAVSKAASVSSSRGNGKAALLPSDSEVDALFEAELDDAIDEQLLRLAETASCAEQLLKVPMRKGMTAIGPGEKASFASPPPAKRRATETSLATSCSAAAPESSNITQQTSTTTTATTTTSSMSLMGRQCQREEREIGLDWEPFAYILDIINALRSHCQAATSSLTDFSASSAAATTTSSSSPLAASARPLRWVVRGLLVSLLTQLQHHSGSRWTLCVRLGDGSSTLDVDVDSDLLARWIGLSPANCQAMWRDTGSQAEQKRKFVRNKLSDFQRRVSNMSGLFVLEPPANQSSNTSSTNENAANSSSNQHSRSIADASGRPRLVDFRNLNKDWLQKLKRRVEQGTRLAS